MSRFTGWTEAAINRILNKEFNPDEIPEALIRKRSQYNHPDYVGMISGALTILGVKHQREYRFLHDRRFRFDIAIPEYKIAIEFEGGIFKAGRHTRGKGYAQDAKKYNLAQMNGWKLLRYTADDARQISWEFKVAEEIKKVIQQDS